MDVTADGLLLRELAPGVSVAEVLQVTEAELRVAAGVRSIAV